ncbi:MAG: hypothetical protein QXL78_00585 [Methanocellales archaeon]
MKGFMVAGNTQQRKAIALALIARLKNMGYRVMPFKTGPDYAHPSHPSLLAKTAAENLDIFTMGRNGVRYVYSRKKDEFDFAVVEGERNIAESKEIAEVLNLPVIAVVECNEAIKVIAGKTLLGRIPRLSEVEIQRKQLAGARFEDELNLGVEKLLEIAQYLNIEGIIKLGRECKFEVKNTQKEVENKPVIGVARDQAFCFYHPYNLEELERRAQIIYFSPLNDELPEVNGLLIGGGYPELYAEQLSRNKQMLQVIKKAAEEGMPIYGECGGLIYLSQWIEIKGKRYEMAGVVPVNIKMGQKLAGYVELRARENCIIAEEGDILRGHEYHYSRAYVEDDVKFAFEVKRGEGIAGKKDGIIAQNTIAQYTHIHAVAHPRFFERFWQASVQYARR